MTTFKIHSLSELNQKELYEILALRAEVFIVEQKCAYQDCWQIYVGSKEHTERKEC